MEEADQERKGKPQLLEGGRTAQWARPRPRPRPRRELLKSLGVSAGEAWHVLSNTQPQTAPHSGTLWQTKKPAKRSPAVLSHCGKKRWQLAGFFGKVPLRTFPLPPSTLTRPGHLSPRRSKTQQIAKERGHGGHCLAQPRVYTAQVRIVTSQT